MLIANGRQRLSQIAKQCRIGRGQQFNDGLRLGGAALDAVAHSTKSKT
jgi:hypothetical protein